MAKLKKYRFEACLVLLIGGIIGLFYLWINFRPQNYYLESLLFLGMIADFVGVFFTLRALWRTKWRKKVSDSFRKIFERVRKLIAKVAEKIYDNSKDDGVLRRGKTTYIFEEREKRTNVSEKRRRPPKWRQLEEDRERMRYLYRGMITSRIKKGERIYSNETPSEIEEREERSPAEKELFQMYVDIRYDERKSVDEEKVKWLKDELEIK